MRKRKITFYHTDHHEFHICKTLSKNAKKYNFDFEFTNDLKKKSDIGFYCLDSNYIKKVNSNLSIITLGGLDQGKLVWPNLWQKESWNKFDLGFLPGVVWKKKWLTSSWDINSRPKKSMNLIGWPKTESIYKNVKHFEKKQKEMTNTIGFKKDKTVIYAPNRELDGKATDVINSISELGLNLIIKQFAWSQKDQIKKFKDLRNNIEESNYYAKKVLGKKVHIVDPSDNIMDYYGLADLLITDESSVIYEALLFDLPSLSIQDWKMGQNNYQKFRSPIIDKDVCFVCLKKDLTKKIDDIFKNYFSYKEKIINKKFDHFSYLENSCENFYHLLNITINSKKNIFEIVPKYQKSYFRFFLSMIILKSKNIIKKYLINFFR